MSSSAALIVAIVAVVALAALVIFATGRRRANVGTLSRETIKRDRSLPGDAPPEAASEAAAEEAASEAARERVDDARRALGAGGGVPATRAGAALAERVPIDEEQLGVTRRQFFNRGIIALTALGLGGFGASLLAFLWPSGVGGFGGKISVSAGLKDILGQIADKKQPFYVPDARAYIQPYPKDALKKAKKVYAPNIYAGMEKGVVALYQKCVHLGCRVPWCQSSQWFECPCHGSKYNRVGEKRGGPAPRGLDRFPITISGDSVTIDTTIPILGPSIGTDTTGQGAEGPPCV